MYLTLEDTAASLAPRSLNLVGEVLDYKVMTKEGSVYKGPRKSSKRNSVEESILEDGGTSVDGEGGIREELLGGSPSCP